MKKLFLYILITFFVGSISSLPIYAQSTDQLELTANSIPKSGSVSGVDVENTRVLNFDFDLSEIPISAEIQDVVFSYEQTNSSTGIVQIIDQFSTVIIDSSTLNAPGSKSSLRFKSIVADWVSNPNSNNGLVFKASSLEADDEVLFTNLTLQISYTVPDKEAPQLLFLFAETPSNNTAKINWRADEEVVVEVEYGKTIKSLSSQGYTSEYLDNGEVLLTNLNPGVSYHYKLTLKDKSGNKTESEIYKFQTSLGAQSVLGDLMTVVDYSELAPPELLNLEPVVQSDEYHLDLAWSESATDDIEGYIIYRSINSKSDYQEYHRTTDDITYFSDESVESEQTYYYFVRTYKGDSISEKSPEKGIFMPPRTDEINEGSSTNNETNIFSPTALIALALLGFTLALLYALTKVFKKVAERKVKSKTSNGLKNILRDPEYYTADYEGVDISENFGSCED